MPLDPEYYKVVKRLVDDMGGRLISHTPTHVLVDKEGWFYPQWFLIGDGCLIAQANL